MATKTILFIEDEQALQDSMAEMLKSEGYEMLAALDGEAGLKVAQDKHPDLILLDLILPKKDGFKVLQELKTDSRLKNVPIIVLTNLEGVGDVEKALALGASTYLVKANYSLEEVVNKIKEALA